MAQEFNTSGLSTVEKSLLEGAWWIIWQWCAANPNTVVLKLPKFWIIQVSITAAQFAQAAEFFFGPPPLAPLETQSTATGI